MTAHEWTALALVVLATGCAVAALFARERRAPQLSIVLFILGALYFWGSIYMLAVQP